MNKIQKDLITKRFQTTMIGALSEFEKAFGYLWGHTKDLNELSSEELKFSDLWEDVRYNILNNGNSQMRKAITDFSHHDYNNNQYKYNFYLKKGDQ